MTIIRNLVFEGCGASGITYAGAISELHNQEAKGNFSFTQLQRVAGTSSGAITALFTSSSASSSDVYQWMNKMNMGDFKDDDIGIIRDANRFITQYGFYKGEKLLNFIQQFIKEKTGNANATFGDLKKAGFKDLYIVTTKMYKRNGVGTCEQFVFSYENAWDTPVAPVVLASAAMPYFFKRVRLNEITKGAYVLNENKGHIYIDGGLVNLYPISLFDNTKYLSTNTNPNNSYIFNKETLGLRVDHVNEIASLRDGNKNDTPIIDNDPIGYCTAFINGSIYGHQDYQFIHENDRDRTIFIDRKNIKATDFDLDNKQKQLLIKSGEEAVGKYFENKHAHFPWLSFFKPNNPQKTSHAESNQNTRHSR